MATITVCGAKGGTGKTTIAVNLAISFDNRKKDVALIDCERGATKWVSQRALQSETNKKINALASYRITGEGTKQQILKVKEKYQNIIIDTHGVNPEKAESTLELRKALLASDLAIVPIKPSQLDVWELSEIFAIISDAVSFNENLYCYLVLSQVPHSHVINGSLRAETLETQNILKKSFKDVSFYHSFIVHRPPFLTIVKTGLSIHELDNNKNISVLNKAQKEFTNFVDETEAIIQAIGAK